MAASSDETERDFKSGLSTRSNIYQFTVDSSLEGNDCVPREENVPNWTTVSVDDDGEVFRSDVVGSGEYSGLEWVLVGEDGGEGTRIDASGSTILDAQASFDQTEGDLTVWIEASYEEGSQRISNELLVEQDSMQADLIVPDFYARYECVSAYDNPPVCQGGKPVVRPELARSGCENQVDPYPYPITLSLVEIGKEVTVFSSLREPEQHETEIALDNARTEWSTIYWMPLDRPVFVAPASMPDESNIWAGGHEAFTRSPTVTEVIEIAGQRVLTQVYEDSDYMSYWPSCGGYAVSGCRVPLKFGMAQVKRSLCHIVLESCVNWHWNGLNTLRLMSQYRWTSLFLNCV